MPKLREYCPCCKKEVDMYWEEMKVPIFGQYDDYDRQEYGSDYRFLCSECNFVITDWSEDND